MLLKMNYIQIQYKSRPGQDVFLYFNPNRAGMWPDATCDVSSTNFKACEADTKRLYCLGSNIAGLLYLEHTMIIQITQ